MFYIIELQTVALHTGIPAECIPSPLPPPPLPPGYAISPSPVPSPQNNVSLMISISFL